MTRHRTTQTAVLCNGGGGSSVLVSGVSCISSCSSRSSWRRDVMCSWSILNCCSSILFIMLKCWVTSCFSVNIIEVFSPFMVLSQISFLIRSTVVVAFHQLHILLCCPCMVCSSNLTHLSSDCSSTSGTDLVNPGLVQTGIILLVQATLIFEVGR